MVPAIVYGAFSSIMWIGGALLVYWFIDAVVDFFLKPLKQWLP